MKSYDVDKLIAQRDTLIEKGVGFFKEKTIGEHVAALVTKNGEVSLEMLILSLQHTVETAPSIDRRKAEAALTYLQSLV